ncbi:RTA1 like protein-domain-containing protein [Thelonectria olida]|uniref:RTA1 like protein-domain-containing protein n=1 Tax=Thelonectria olida TaxID=1576542 RepID=A0A9P9AUV7_9HYPO|nr:RTA1 like protein-domain-containing protein [Thelonectria olida]
MTQLKPYRGDYYLWHYIPSVPAAGLFAALFIIGSTYVAWQTCKTKAKFCIVFIIGGLFEVVGYCARAAAKDKTDQLMPYVIQSIFILLAPALFAASVYMVLGRLIRSLGAERHSIVPIRWLTKIFVCGDVVSFLVQGTGGGIMTTADSTKTGEYIILGGLFVQIIIFALFGITAAIFHSRMRQWPTGPSLETSASWEAMMVMLYTVSVLIMVRSIFRVIEYAMGYNGFLLKNEWTLYVFDALPMFGVVAVFCWWFPGHPKPRKPADYEMAQETSQEM